MAKSGRKINQGSKWIQPVKRQAIYFRDERKCVYCGKDDTQCTLSLDHIVTASADLKAGKKQNNKANNLVTCCLDCNRRRNAKTIEEWIWSDNFNAAETIRLMFKIEEVQATRDENKNRKENTLNKDGHMEAAKEWFNKLNK